MTHNPAASARAAKVAADKANAQLAAVQEELVSAHADYTDIIHRLRAAQEDVRQKNEALVAAHKVPE